MLDYLKNKIIVFVLFIGTCVAAYCFCPGSFVFAQENYEFVSEMGHGRIRGWAV